MPDLRLPLLGTAAWVGAFAVMLVAGHGALAWWTALATVMAFAAGMVTLRHAPAARRLLLAAVAVGVLAAGVAGLRLAALEHDPVAQLAADRELATITGTVTSDPHVTQGTFSTTVVVRLTVRRVEAGRVQVGVRTPVVVLGDTAWERIPLGATVRFTGRLNPADDHDVSAEVTVRRSSDDPAVRVVDAPDAWWRAASVVRHSIRRAVAHRPDEEAALVPALVDGDDADVSEALADDFRATGLTHLLAVSGTNLTLLVGALLTVARWCRVRGRWMLVVGATGIVGFILLARTEPSVVRAAAMGAVGLVAMSSNGRHRALRGLGAAVLGLILLDPAISTSLGFALSVLATAGILLLGPPWRDALRRWLPRWLAEAIAVPMAAQLACTPLIAAISGQVSLSAVGANLVAEPAVGPATVLGLLGGVVGLVAPPLGAACGWLASWCVAWIITIAHRGAALPVAQIGWATTPVALVLLTLLTVTIALWGPRVVQRRWIGLPLAVLLIVIVAVRLPGRGWPPAGWVMVMCDVGQGDGLVLSVGEHAAMVVDTGPEPAPMERCLDDLGITTVPLLVLTHFDADHVSGVSAVFSGRTVGAVWTTVLHKPDYGIGLVHDATAAAGVTPVSAVQGTTFSLGPITAQVLWPPPDLSEAVDSNAGSITLLLQSHGIRFLLTGDLDPDGGARIATAVPGLRVDVLKVPHHGSRFQDEPWLLSLHPRIALTSVGADNDYGHPAASTLDPLTAEGVEVHRTDTEGALAVVARADGPVVVHQ
ncbi:ComEC/Rec2 family competence protein [Nocardioides sp. Kera G14]|uniref:ComEC/Rec2 family competence protein n=1 Tax=Nocardioides sp. Kera G14 TaxID=2884264 RepID=UPI001D0FF9D7|nr:ComEC/Rec2 family competence protein [Nocardioides sp. Kera G14]UDY24810.1 ComEC/Rec2 family competence protein [Nocardioides sp. Kera G14]